MKKTEEVNIYLLLDRSQSMGPKWNETLGSVNCYVEELNKNKTSGKITIATFDKHDGVQFDIIRNAVTLKGYKPITTTDATPRGLTPLFDAIGRAVNLAEKANDNKTIMVIMTDGEENASVETTKEAAKAALDRCRAKGWQVVFLGADFDAFGQGASVGVQGDQVIAMAAGSYTDTMRGLGAKTMMYASANATMSFDANDRAEAMGKNKKII